MAQAQTATSSQPHPPAVAVAPVFARLARSRFAFGLRTQTSGGGESSSAGASGSKNAGRKQYTDENDEEWYIPYNGPIARPPKGLEEGMASLGGGIGKRLVNGSDARDSRVRDSWGDLLDNARAGVSGGGAAGLGMGGSVGIGAGLGGASLSGSGHGHGYGSAAGHSRLSVVTSEAGEEHHQQLHHHQQPPHAHFSISSQQQPANERDKDMNKLSRGRSRTRDRALSAASRYTDSTGVASPGMSPRSVHTMGHGTGVGVGRLPVPSFLNLDQTATGIGESPVPAQRGGGGGHAHGYGLAYGAVVASGAANANANGATQNYGHDLSEFGQVPDGQALAGHQAHAQSPSQQAVTGTHANAAHTSVLSSAPSASMHAGTFGGTSTGPSSFPVQQSQNQNHQQQRGSFASFWTFGGNKRSPTHQAQPSVETFWSRPSTSTYGTGIVNSPAGVGANGGIGAAPVARSAVTTRERAATIDDRFNLMGQPVIDLHSHSSTVVKTARPRANTSGGQLSGPGTGVHTGKPNGQGQARSTVQQTHSEQYAQSQQMQPQQAPPLYTSPTSPMMRDPPSAGSDDTDSPYQRVPHPYAVAFPNRGHREASRLLQPVKSSASEKQPPSYGELRVPVLNLPSRFSNSSSNNGIPAHLKNQPSKLIKASISTPNLRAAISRQASYGRPNGGSQPNTPGFANKWLSAETWCDALIFPRPRFKVRATAHAISPPESPLQDDFVHVPLDSAPLQDEKTGLLHHNHQPQRVLKKSAPKEREAQDALSWLRTPTSAPPQFASPVPPEYKPAGTMKPPRPKSFAQDDLALPSPAPSLSTVIREGAKLDKDRADWKNEATKSFGNKRSRSLSRSRMRAMTYRQKGSEEDLATSFDMLATRAFLGSQALQPAISAPNTSSSRSATNTTSFGTTSTHSRKSSGVSQPTSRGHSRKESWGRTVVKTAKSTANATGFCAFTVDNAVSSPSDEKEKAINVALSRENTRYLKASEQLDGRRDEGEGGVLLIGPHTMPQKGQPQPQKRVALAPSPTPSNQTTTSHTGVGVAISTPVLQPTHPDDAIRLPDHPYASVSNKRSNDPPRASDYAGPHPTSSKIIDLQLNGEAMNDVSLRHRLPPSAGRVYATHMLHPYANGGDSRPKPTLRLPVQTSVQASRMFAQTTSGDVREIQPDEIQYSPYSQPSPSKASPNYSTDALGVEEALNVAFQRGEPSVKSGTGERSESASEVVRVEQEQFDYQKLVPIPSSSSRFAILPRQDPEERESWQNPLTPAELRANFPKEYSPAHVSLDSSPMTSPRRFVASDDVDEYNDLFYRPGRQSDDEFRRTPSSEVVRTVPSRETSGVDGHAKSSSSSASISALQNLTRQLSEEYGSRIDDEHTFGPNDSFGMESDYRDSQYSSQAPQEDHRHVSASPPGPALPLRMQSSRPLSFAGSPLIPEDVESSRASSILERSEDPHDGTVVFQRVGEVEALATPNPTAIQNGTTSARGSYIEDLLPPIRVSEEITHPHEERTKRRPNLSSLIVPTPTSEGTRASYVTSISDASRISQLSDFPVPPHLDTMTPSYMVQSFYEEIDREAIHNTIRNRRHHPERRTTFGNEPDLLPLDSNDH